MPNDDFPASFWRKVVSIEFLSILFLIGLSWGALTSKVMSLESQVQDQKQAQNKDTSDAKQVTDELSKEVNTINRKVDVLGTNQEHFKVQIERMDDRLERIQTILERQQ